MVLIAPRTVRPAAPPGPVDRGAGGDVLALLRGDTSARPRFDPGLAGGLRAWLEDAAYEIVAARGEHAPTLFLGPRQLLGSPPERREQDGGESLSEEVVLSRLVHALFRQLVHTGDIDDPLADALEALRAGDGEEPWSTTSSRCPPRTVCAGGGGGVARGEPTWSGAPVRTGWMPRTDDRVATPLAGGRVVLHGVFDLMVGLPQPGTASLCALGLATGGPWAWHRRSLHYLALLETLRTGTPRSAWRCSNRRRVATASRTCARSTSGPSPHTSRRGSPARPPPMIDRLTGELVAPLPAVDAASWLAALADAKSILANLAVRRGATGPFRVTDHDVRAALCGEAGDRVDQEPFAWSARTARRALGLAAVRLLVAGRARSPADGVQARLAESSLLGARGQLVRLAARSLARRAPACGTWGGWRRSGDVGDPPVVRPGLVSLLYSRPSSAGTAGGTAPTRRCWPSAAGLTCARRSPTWSCCPVPAAARCGRSSPW